MKRELASYNILLLITQHIESAIYISLIIYGLSLSILSIFDSAFMVGLGFIISNLMFSFFYALLYSYISESNPKWFSKMGAAYVNTAQPIIMIFFIAYCYFYGSWNNILIHFTGIPITIIAICGFILQYRIKTNPSCVAYIKLEINSETE